MNAEPLREGKTSVPILQNAPLTLNAEFVALWMISAITSSLFWKCSRRSVASRPNQ
jgi:hypothetical protein